MDRPGYEKLWGWFGLSYASFLTLPRVFMHEMSDEWQSKMADLLEEFDETFDLTDLPSPSVSAKGGNRFTSWPGWLLNYRYPVCEEIVTRSRVAFTEPESKEGSEQ